MCKGCQLADCSLHESLLCQESMTNAEAWEILICFGIGYHSWNSRTSESETFSKYCSFSSLAAGTKGLAAFWSGWIRKKQGRRNLASGMVIRFATRNKKNYNNKIIEFSVHLILFIQLLLLADGCHGLAAFWSGWLIKKQGRRMCFWSGGGKFCNNRKQVKKQVYDHWIFSTFLSIQLLLLADGFYGLAAFLRCPQQPQKSMGTCSEATVASWQQWKHWMPQIPVWRLQRGRIMWNWRPFLSRFCGPVSGQIGGRKRASN